MIETHNGTYYTLQRLIDASKTHHLPPRARHNSTMTDKEAEQAVLYIVLVLMFYSVGIVAAIVSHLRREEKEIEEERIIDKYRQFKYETRDLSFLVQQTQARLDLLDSNECSSDEDDFDDTVSPHRERKSCMDWKRTALHKFPRTQLSPINETHAMEQTLLQSPRCVGDSDVTSKSNYTCFGPDALTMDDTNDRSVSYSPTGENGRTGSLALG